MMASAYDDFRYLNAAIDSTPLIDNHAHPLLTPENVGTRSLLSIASEAGGSSLEESKSSLSHIRAVKQLAEVLGCEQTWEAVVANIERKRLESRDGWIKHCLEGIEAILIDDGLDVSGRVESYDWHSNFTKSKCKRIVRIETVASDIIARLCITDTALKKASAAMSDFVDAFTREIKRLTADPEVVGFKSIICYRRGLDITPAKDLQTPKAGEALMEILKGGLSNYTAGSEPSGFSLKKRLEHSPLNDLIVHYVAVVIRDTRTSPKKPIQFHTGLGDTDITLTKSSPSHLQTFIEEYPEVPVILLHAGYPWTRETAYLAAMYPNAYADIGEVFPYLSRQGQEGIVKQMLEVCPWTKILCSTDAHGFPEMYLIATTQIRSVLKTVLGELVRANQLNERQAVQLVQAIMHSNSKKVYNLETTSTLPTFEQLGAFPYNTAAQLPRDPTPATNELIIRKLESLRAKYLRVYWHDYTSTAKCRLIPIRQVYKTLASGKPVTVSVAKAGLGLLQTDMMIPQINASGMFTLHPDWSSLRPGPVAGHVMCFGDFTQLDGSEEMLCPRTVLRKTVQSAKDEGYAFLLGFEVEFVVMERNPDAASPDKYLTLRNDGHSWSTARSFADWGRRGSFSTAADEILSSLDAAGITVEQFHPESAAGQYELVLSPLPPLEACDNLLQARQILESVAARHGFRVTLHPKPFPAACGSASHMHMSISSSPNGNQDDPQVYESFYAGVLTHLRAILAFTYSNPTSYARMQDSLWAGGRWITWGTQNKEAPLRKVEGSHWEIKVIDGLANPYFVVTAILSAGMDGIRREEPLTWGDCQGDPAKLSIEERKALGIETMFPADLREALKALGDDTSLELDEKFVQRYVDIKYAELKFLLDPLSPEDLRRWVLERY
ncbi:glutamine synthetase/guanido kinase [Hypoxylon rubiginosum]|uniref:Glutamine synthetase/guanido kinase n=1 Tax=Hypoxylon rubiginosum TaxID=110542 RepID=A0ACC0CWE3_9PEZI|nr:glutamine synthetase/guanido kinase [Hypoxylon rubiginosum]